MGDGSNSNNPWLQELPDPLSRACWDNYLTMSASTARDLGIKRVAIAGGVSANSGLRDALNTLEKNKGFEVYIPDFQYCTDNAGMICISAYYQYKASTNAQTMFRGKN